MANEVRIKLTDEQKAKIKEATGKELPEIRVESFGDTPAVSHPDAAVAARTTARRQTARVARAFMAKRATAKNLLMKRATAKHIVAKRATAKRATAKHIVAKRATAKRATAKHIVAKRATAKR